MKPLIKLLILSSIQAVSADVPPDQQPEVDHLLDYVRQSDCLLIRNGSEYPGKKGVSHIQKKYDYYKDHITTTEEFIKYSATKSTLSGKYYTIRCPGKVEMRTRDWLLDELADFRGKSAGEPPQSQ